ncbi:MAG: transcription elongation factor Spt5 [Candidatus Burarchaeum sp.]|nr:transcription elongation factor Spt5 [Candidatus Burarchaeum sp.]MDO8339881.1 transcription elongation factor Spt5 [Candidatus Burarchaeum sp.]
MLFVYRVTAGQEKVVADVLRHKVEKDKLPVYSIAMMNELRGYLIIEAQDEVVARQAAMRMPHIKGVLSKSMDIKELDSMIGAASPALSVKKGDIVELISGPFKGEKARVIKIDENKDELTVELTEVAVPIPVTIKSHTIRSYQKAEDVSS